MQLIEITQISIENRKIEILRNQNKFSFLLIIQWKLISGLYFNSKKMVGKQVLSTIRFLQAEISNR